MLASYTASLALFVALKDDPSFRYQDKNVFFLEYAPFYGSCFETSRDDRVYSTLRFHTNGCKTVLHMRVLRFLLGEPSMYRHGLGTRTERLSMSHMVDMMPI